MQKRTWVELNKVASVYDILGWELPVACIYQQQEGQIVSVERHFICVTIGDRDHAVCDLSQVMISHEEFCPKCLRHEIEHPKKWEGCPT